MNKLALFHALLLGAAASAGLGQEITYQIGTAEELLDPTFYAGEVIDGSDAQGRTVFVSARPSNDGRLVAVLTANRATLNLAVFLVDVGDPSSWRRLTADGGFTIDVFVPWTPDDQFLVWRNSRIPIETGGFLPYSIFGVSPGPFGDVSFTGLESGNWLASEHPGVHEITLFPVLPDGSEDLSRTPVVVADFSEANENDEPTITPDGSALVFAEFRNQSPGADLGNIRLIRNLETIREAPLIPSTNISTLAPTTFTDSNVIPIRTDESPNFNHGTYMSQDGQLVIYGEDWNNAFNDDDFFGTVAAGDWDIMISRADGTGEDFRIAQPGNQSIGGLFRGGPRVVYLTGAVADPNEYHALITSIEVHATTPGTPVGDNDIETTTTLTISDGSRSEIEIPPGTVIDFPPAAPPQIVISTPIDPVGEAQLPPGGEVDGIPVVREFRPEGAQFSPPISVTLAYTDAEIAGLSESTLRPYLYNGTSGIFDTPVPEEDILERNPEENYIRFQVDHFSVYGLAGSSLLTASPKWRTYD